MKTSWKDILGYGGDYQISNHGDVRSCKTGKWKVLARKLNTHGYFCSWLYKNGKVKGRRNARLVALAFVENPHNKPQVNHIDGNKQNDCVDNLEWCTARENVQHAYDTGLAVSPNRGENCHNHKLNEHQVRRIRLMREINPKMMYKSIAKMFGVTKDAIGLIVRRERWAHVDDFDQKADLLLNKKK